MKFHKLNKLPPELLNIAAEDLCTVLPGPTLIHVQGEIDPPLFISTLLHGNETTGFYALQQYLRQHPTPPRSLLIFLGNIKAANYRLRRLQEQADYNRIWDGAGDTPEHLMAQALLSHLRQQPLFAAIDIHNNTGNNPHYPCINKLEPQFINLASLFDQRIVYFTRPKEVLSLALAEFCTSLTLECGLSEQREGQQHVVDFLDQCSLLTELNISQHQANNTKIYQSIAKINVPQGLTISFKEDDNPVDFRLVNYFEDFNFKTLTVGTLLGQRYDPQHQLSVTDESGREVSDLFLSYHNNEIRIKREVIGSMFTKNIKNIELDCLGYFMKEIITAE